MNIYNATYSYLLSELQTVPFEKAIHTIEYRFAHPSSHWLLPLYTCQAFGGGETCSIPAIAALIAIQTAILLVDDLLDNDGRREILGLSIGETANLSMVFQAIGVECMSRNLPAAELQMQVVGHINQTMLETAYGQHLDNLYLDSEEAYWQAARAKSCPFFGLAFYLGSVASGVSENSSETILNLGRLYGEMIQIHDDLSDNLSDKIGSDWIQKRAALPILFARIVDHPDRDKFLTLTENIVDSYSLHQAQEILLGCGAVSYCIDQIVQRHKTATLLLSSLTLPDPQPLQRVFDEIIEPVLKLLGKQG